VGILWLSHFNEVGNTLSPDVTGEKMDACVKRESFRVRTGVVTRQAVFQDTRVTAEPVGTENYFAKLFCT
jgi:hypothetical protein